MTQREQILDELVEKQNRLIQIQDVTIFYFRKYSGESERISRFMDSIKQEREVVEVLQFKLKSLPPVDLLKIIVKGVEELTGEKVVSVSGHFTPSVLTDKDLQEIDEAEAQKAATTQRLYCLCSQVVIDKFPEAQRSKPFKSGYPSDDSLYYVALLDYIEATKYYDEVVEPHNSEENRPHYIDYWFRVCQPAMIDTSHITKASLKKNGIFSEMEDKVGLTNDSNRAYMIYELAKKYNTDPISFINSIVK